MTNDGTESVESPGRDGQWINHGTLRTVYSNWWMTLTVDRVEKPDGSIVEHEVVKGPDAAGMVVLDRHRGLLMIWRHRFMPGTWGWEIPGGAIDLGEDPERAARRECLEETGWEVSGGVQHLSRHHPSCGFVRQTFDLYLADEARHRGEPSDKNEAQRVAWRSVEEVAVDLATGAISDGFTQLAVTLALVRRGYGEVLDRPLDLGRSPESPPKSHLDGASTPSTEAEHNLAAKATRGATS